MPTPVKEAIEPHRQLEKEMDFTSLEAHLSPRMRAVVKLTRTGYEPVEIAARLGYNTGSVRKIRQRGEKAMREAFLTGSLADTPCSDPEQDEP